VRTLTLAEVNEKYGGKLPPDATLRPDIEPARPAPKPNRRGRRGERFAILNAFVDVSLAGLTGAEAKVWMILFRDTKASTGTARTGQSDMARRAGIDARSVRRALETLQAKGMIHLVRRGRLNGGPSIYRVHPTGTP
jgi:hypothetical protein